ncbi:hypothetical protein JTB14_003959 [Gonioctena quinquepunctata]|nr:hypothetical protein JTB14_003959 [Gonioctena quinquepunctata]
MWEEQNSEPLIYVFDPNPRGPTGMPVFTGTACLLSFANAKMTAEHLLRCILDPDQKLGRFTIVPVEIVVGNVSTTRKLRKTPVRSGISILPRCSKLICDEEKKLLRKMAEANRRDKNAKLLQMIGRRGYHTLKGGYAILRGYRSQNSPIYGEESRNNQDIPNCILAVVMYQLLPIENWTSKTIDQILDAGNQLYVDSYIAYGPKDIKLGMENVVRKFFLENNLIIHVTIYKPIISDFFSLENVDKVLNIFFQQEQYCLFSYLNQWVSIFFKGGQFYMFDPHERDINGNSLVKKRNGVGVAVVVRFDDLNGLVLKLISNIPSEGRELFTIWIISVEIK